MEKYYIIKTGLENESTGPVHIQAPLMKEGYDYNAENSVDRMERTKFPYFIPNMNYYELDPKAKSTDVISVQRPHFGFLINERTKHLIENFELPTHRLYKAYVGYSDKEVYENYYFIHIVSDFTERIDFGRTQFFINKMIAKEKVDSLRNAKIIDASESWPGSKNVWVKIDLELSSTDELLSVYKKFSKSPATDQYYFKDDFRIPYDLFYLGKHDIRMYASLRIKEKFEEGKITGIEFHECRWLKG